MPPGLEAVAPERGVRAVNGDYNAFVRLKILRHQNVDRTTRVEAQNQHARQRLVVSVRRNLLALTNDPAHHVRRKRTLEHPLKSVPSKLYTAAFHQSASRESHRQGISESK